jgi:hypothetical protein
MGSVRLSASSRFRNASQSGGPSSRRIVTTVDLNRGSLSIAQVKASVFRPPAEADDFLPFDHRPRSHRRTLGAL